MTVNVLKKAVILVYIMVSKNLGLLVVVSLCRVKHVYLFHEGIFYKREGDNNGPLLPTTKVLEQMSVA